MVQELPEVKSPQSGKIRHFYSVVKRLLGIVLPFILMVAVAYLVYFVWDFAQYDLDPEDRQQALERNWGAYLDRSDELGNIIDLDKFELTLCPFTNKRAWTESKSPEAAGLICGNVTMPLFHDQPDGDTIRIPIAIWPYYDLPNNPDPLFVAQGGPGGSTLNMYPRKFSSSWPAGKRDVIFVDQRGTLFADPSLLCPEELEQLLKSSPETRKKESEQHTDLIACRARLEKEGVNLDAFNTAEIAQDYEAVRQVLGYQKINFYGVSYGSHIGQYLASLYPESLRSIIFDGVAPIPLNYINRSYPDANRALIEFKTSCEHDPSCYGKYPDIMDQLEEVIARLDQKPVKVVLHNPYGKESVVDVIDGEAFFDFVFDTFYQSHNYGALPFIISQAEKNRFDLYIYYSEWDAFGESFSRGLYFSVICSEHTPFNESSASISYALPSMTDWEEESLEWMKDACQIWSVDRPELRLNELPVSDVPALLLSGQFDPVTPPEYGEIALKSFSQGLHLIDPVAGHGIAFDDDCTKTIFGDFLDDPLGNLDAECLSDPDRHSLAVPPGAINVSFVEKAIDSDFNPILLIIFPVIMIVVMIVRGALQYIRYLWQNARGTLSEQSNLEKKLRLQFELATWVFVIGWVGLISGFMIFISRIYDIDTYGTANALPGGVRTVLLIPVLLSLVLPIVMVPAVRLWRNTEAVLGRFYFLLQVVFCLGTIAFMVWAGWLLAWV